MFFFDESRFGTHSKIGRAWLEKGKRSPMPVKLGFENFYLYSAVEPKTGTDFTLEITHVNTHCMNAYLVEFSRVFSTKEIILVMDGASWHQSKQLKIPPNIEIVYLPPYSPELNPTERFWQHIKNHTIKNKIYENLSLLSTTLEVFLKGISSDTISSLCAVNYLAI